MKVIQVAGYKKTGKTTVSAELVKTIAGRGFQVAVIKHSHSDADGVDTDSRIFRNAGAAESVFTNDREQLRYERVPSLDMLLLSFRRRFDIVILEGWKEIVFPRIVCMSDDASSLLTGAFGISGLAAQTKQNLPEGFPVFNALDAADINRLADMCLSLPDYPAGINCRHCGMSCRELYLAQTCGENVECTVKESGNVVITVNGKKLEMSQFIETIVTNTVTGLVSSLKGYEQGDIEIVIRQDGK